MAIVSGANVGSALGAASNIATMLTNAGAPVDGTSGTGANLAHPGALLIDTTNFVVSINTNTRASPTWKAVTPLRLAGVPVDGTSGTGVGYAKGTLCVDITNANLYINVNTAASPTWKLFTRAA